MDLMTMNGDYQPDKMVEGWASLIWTERFNIPGDFQIQIPNVSYGMTMLPEGRVVTLRESTVPMIVETHNIVRKKHQPEMLVVTGRSFESILDRRLSVRAVEATGLEWTVTAKIPSDAAYYAINQICVVGVANAADIFPPSDVVFVVPDDYLAGTGPNRSFVIPKQNLLTTVQQFIQAEAKADATTVPPTPAVVPHGIRSRRPNLSGSAVAVEIYTGQDLSDTIYFDGTRELLDDGSYLLSKVGSANTAYCLGSSGAVTLNEDATAATGFDRRVILVDGSSSELDEAGLTEQGKIALAEAHVLALFDGTINPDLSPYIYGDNSQPGQYELGDIVRLAGDYGIDQKARVTEYIRSEDAAGFKAYPTLTTITD